MRGHGANGLPDGIGWNDLVGYTYVIAELDALADARGRPLRRRLDAQVRRLEPVLAARSEWIRRGVLERAIDRDGRRDGGRGVLRATVDAADILGPGGRWCSGRRCVCCVG